MKETNELLALIRAARLAMEKELSEKKAAYESERAHLQAALSEKKNTDYLSEDVRAFAEAKESTERFYQKFLCLTEGGAPYRASEMLAAARPSPVREGEALKSFAALLEKTKEAVRLLDRSESAEADARPFETLCGCLCDLRFFAKEGRALLCRDGIDTERCHAACAPIEEKIAALTKKYEDSIRRENLFCYAMICEAGEAAAKVIEEAKSTRLGAHTPKTRFDYRFLVAFEHTEIESEDAAFIRNVLGLDPDRMTEIPVFYRPEKDQRAILIRAHEDFFYSPTYDALLWNLYYAAASKMPPHAVHLTGAECGNTSRLGLITENYVKQLKGGATDIPCEISALDTNELTKYLFEQTKIQRSRHFANFYEHNRKNKHAPEPLLLVFMNEYPCGFQNYRDNGSTHILNYLSGVGPRLGVLPIVCQNEDSDAFHPINAPHFEGDKYFTIDCTDPTNIRIDGRAVSLDVRAPYMDDEALFVSLAEHFDEKDEVFPLADVLEAADEEGEAELLPLLQLHAPIGLVNGAPYYHTFQAGANEHTIILGGSNAGKSSVLHTLILSLAHRYSPEEVQFYLADFKSGDVSPEFSNYLKTEEEDNLYIPHVRYLQVHTDTADALDMLKSINKLYNERLDFFKKHGSNDFTSYHRQNLERIKSGELPRIPMTFFIIDEYRRMIEGAQNRADAFYDQIKDELKSIISTVRSGGIALVLVDQTMKGITNEIYDNGTNIPNRVIVGTADKEQIQRFYYSSDKNTEAAIDADHAFLNSNVKGRIMIGNTRAHARFRIAFAGNATSDEAKRTAAAIRKKYAHIKTSQILGGSMTAFPAAEGLAGITAAHAHTLCAGYHDIYRMELALGVQSTGGLACTLDYVTEGVILPGCFLTANELARAAIERNTVLAFLHRTAGHYRYDAPRIDFCASMRGFTKALGAYTGCIPNFDRHVRTVSDFEAMARCIMGYKALMDEREKQRQNAASVTFTPQLLVIDDVSWITDQKGLPSIPKTQAPRTETESAAAALSEANADTLRMLAEAGVEDFPSEDIFALMADMQAEGTDSPEMSFNEYFTHRDLTDALYKLYTDGTKNGIFLLMAASDEGVLSEFCDTISHRTIHIKNNLVFSKGGAQDHCYIENSTVPVPKKTRLYHYEADENDPFFRALSEKLS